MSEMNFIPDRDLVNDGIVMQKSIDGLVETNIPWNHSFHSPGGFSWGYAGSGPADFALNIMEASLDRMGYEGPAMKFTDDIIIFSLTARHYQDFKEIFLANIPEEGGVIPWSVVERWLQERIQMQATQDEGTHEQG